MGYREANRTCLLLVMTLTTMCLQCAIRMKLKNSKCTVKACFLIRFPAITICRRPVVRRIVRGIAQSFLQSSAELSHHAPNRSRAFLGSFNRSSNRPINRGFVVSLIIPPALWATGGLAIVSIQLPLSLPSPRASDPAGLDDSRVYIILPTLQKAQREHQKTQGC